MTSTGPSRVGTGSTVIELGRSIALISGLVILVACTPTQAGSAAQANRAADDFLLLLKNGRADATWSLLTPATQEAAYGGNLEAFRTDVLSAHWPRVSWDFSTVTDLDISWGVHVETGDSFPDFLVRAGIAGEWTDGIVLLVQFVDDRYFIAGQGLDEDLRR